MPSNLMKRAGFAFIALLLLVTIPQATDFGGYRSTYQGWGATSRGGRNGIVCAVNSLTDTATGVAIGGTGNPDYRGTLRYCLVTRTEPRIVVFETSGTIQLSSPLAVVTPYVTVAGQTAPSPGITIRATYGIRIESHDMVWQHVRLRMGRHTGYEKIVLRLHSNGQPVYNIVIDHMSISWGCDMLIATSYLNAAGPQDILVTDTILSEALLHQDCVLGDGFLYAQGMNLGYSANGTGTVIRNLFVDNYTRNPRIDAGYQAIYVNNVVYNPVQYDPGGFGTSQNYLMFCGTGSAGTPCNGIDDPLNIVVMGNVFIPGMNTPTAMPAMRAQGGTLGSTYYLKDNVGPGITDTSGDCTTGGQWAGVQIVNKWVPTGAALTKANICSYTLPSWYTAFNIAPLATTGDNHLYTGSSTARTYVLAHAGARPVDRDSVDTRVVACVSGFTCLDPITDEANVGGFPALAVNTRAYTVPVNPNSAGSCGATTAGVSRTTVECDLETKALALEGQAPLPSVPAVTISTPSNLYETTSSTLTTLAGTSSTATGTITGCVWTNTVGGSGSGSTTGTTSWSVASITLTANVVNRITVTCTNSFSNSTSAYIDTLYVPTPGSILDAFTRSGWTTPGPSWTGQTTGVRGSVSNNQLTSTSASEAAERFSAVAAPNNQCTQATVKSVAASSKWVGVTVRSSGADATRNSYVVRTDGTTETLSKIINGVSTQLDTNPVSFVGGDILKLCVVSQSLQVYKNAVEVGTATTVTSSTLASGSAGIVLQGVGAALDDISGSTATDITPPTISITAPATSGSYTATSTPFTLLAGVAADNIAVSSVTWVNSAGGSGTATGTATWSVASISLTAGTNNITVTAHDAAGNTTPTIISVNYIPPTPVTPPIVTITSFNTNYETGSSTLTSLAGTAFSSGGTITGCTWANTVGGSGSGSTTGTTSWTVPSITLTANVINRIIVTCVDNLSQTGSSQVDVLYVPPPSSAADNFNRANWPTLGPNWTAATSAVAKILSNQANGASASSHYMIFTSWALTNDQCSQATIRGLTSSVVGTLIRANGSSSYLLATDGSSGAGHSYIGKVISGTITQLGALSTTYTTGDTVKLCVIGTSLQAYKNGSAIGSPVSDSSLTSGYAGIYLSGTAAAIDDFIGSNTSGTVPNKLPIANPGGPYTGTHNVAVKVDASHSSAQRGVLKRFVWQWGDGSSDSSVKKPITTHTFTAAGTYTITLTVTDSRNQTSLPVSTTVTVS